MLSVFIGRPPDIIVSHDAQVIAVRASGGDYMLSTPRGGRFLEETWLRRAGA